MISTTEAARRLGMTPRRVVALIASGDLDATKLGRSWAVDEQSVALRAASPKLRGRPCLGDRNAANLETYTLMNANHEVAQFTYNKALRQVAKVESLDEYEWAPPGACAFSGKVDRFNLNDWLLHRPIPKARSGIGAILRDAGVEDTRDLMFSSLGLNLSDQYWFKPAGANIDWHQINYFENDYVDGVASEWRDANARRAFGPGTSTDGQLPKHWEKRGDTSWLIKGSEHQGREPFAEALSSMLYTALLEPRDFVPYKLEHTSNGQALSACPCMVTPTTELIPMDGLLVRYGLGGRGNLYDAYANLLEEHGIANARTQLAKMIVCDYLTANIDRHTRNLGIIRDAETLAWRGTAPIFDNGRAFYFTASRPEDLTRGLFRYESNPFEDFPSRQLALVEDFSWFDASALDGFTEVIVDVLSQNDLAPAWFSEAAATQFSRRLERICEAQEERG